MDFSTALIVYGLISLVYLLAEVSFHYMYYGFTHGWSSNRPDTEPRPALGKRIANSFQNQTESAAYIVPVLAAAAVMGVDHAGAELAALLVILGRAAFGPLYWTGIPFIRIPAWGMAWISTAYIAVILLTS